MPYLSNSIYTNLVDQVQSDVIKRALETGSIMPTQIDDNCVDVQSISLLDTNLFGQITRVGIKELSDKPEGHLYKHYTLQDTWNFPFSVLEFPCRVQYDHAVWWGIFRGCAINYPFEAFKYIQSRVFGFINTKTPLMLVCVCTHNNELNAVKVFKNNQTSNTFWTTSWEKENIPEEVQVVFQNLLYSFNIKHVPDVEICWFCRGEEKDYIPLVGGLSGTVYIRNFPTKKKARILITG